MAIYYRDDAVTVSSTGIEVDERRYALGRLTYVWHRTRRAGSEGRHLRARMLGTAILGTALAGAVIAGLLLVDFGQYRWYVMTGAILIATVLTALAGFSVDPVLDLLDRGHEHARGIHEAWARIDGREILLFSTPDEFRFGKVYRALQRAIERAG